MLTLITQREVKGKYRKSDSLEQEYIDYLSKFGINLMPVPNNTDLVESYFNLPVTGIILAGGNDVGESINSDNTERVLLNIAIKKNIPVLGICRGMQFINHYFKGSLSKVNNHVNVNHHIHILDQNPVLGRNAKVNSFHNQGVLKADLALELKVFAESEGAEENVIEGIYHPDYSIAGIMWHPERKSPNPEINEKIINAFLNRKLYWGKK